jgi:excinuclease UvrABC ATPase subunit
VCGAHFVHPSAEFFAFNSYGACPACHGLGVRSEVDAGTLVPDPGKTIEQGAVLPWNSGGRRLSIARTPLKIAYQVLKTGTPYTDLGADFYTRRESPAQQHTYLERRLQRLYPGRTITITIGPPEAALAFAVSHAP